MIDLDALLQFLKEDAPAGDITTESVIPDITCSAVIRAEEVGILAGVDEASALFSHFGVAVTPGKRDGEAIRSGDIVVSLQGPARKILLVERTALNIMGRMSGIATRTASAVAIVRRINPGCRIAGTRKTCPGFRSFDKRAVIIGGGDPHRTTLSDGILIKDNHLALVSPEEAVTRARQFSVYRKVEIEVESAGDAVRAAEAGADIVMFDNMTPAQVREAISLLEKRGMRERIVIEVSGGIRDDSLQEFAAAGADVISMGALTHSVRNFSFSLEIQKS